MEAIGDIIVAKPTLPARFISDGYDGFLFFDFFLRGEVRFFEKLKKLIDLNQGIEIYYAETLRLLGKASSAADWSEVLRVLDDRLTRANEPFGIVILSADRRWVMAQDMSVNWGVLAFRKNDVKLAHIFESMQGEWFLGVDDFLQAEADPKSVLHGVFDDEFIRQVVANYGMRAG